MQAKPRRSGLSQTRRRRRNIELLGAGADASASTTAGGRRASRRVRSSTTRYEPGHGGGLARAWLCASQWRMKLAASSSAHEGSSCHEVAEPPA